MNGSSLNELLESLGLTEYESRALSTLFELGEAEAPAISRLSQVPKTRVYDVLDKLVKRSLVIEMRGRPKKYRVMESKKVLDTLIESKKSELSGIEEKAMQMQLELQGAQSGSEKGETVMKVKDAKDFERILGQEVGKAENSVMAFAEISDKHNVLQEAISKANERNVSMKVLNAFPNTVVKKSVKELKHLEHGLNAFVIDGKKVVMALSDLKRELPEYHFAIWHDNKPMASALQHYFDKCWQKAKTI